MEKEDGNIQVLCKLNQGKSYSRKREIKKESEKTWINRDRNKNKNTDKKRNSERKRDIERERERDREYGREKEGQRERPFDARSAAAF